MAYIFDSYINENKPLSLSLTKIVGIGKTKSKKICYELGIQSSCTLQLLQDSQYKKLRKLLNLELTGKRLVQKQRSDINQLIQKRCYRGIRHKNNLPVRGQRTHSNAKTQKKRSR